MSAPLSSELRSKYNRRSFPIRQGDTVKIVRGDFEGIEGKVTELELSRQRIIIQGVTREKVSGTATKVPIHPSKVMITNLNLDDRWRADILKRPTGTQAAPAEAPPEPTATPSEPEKTEDTTVSSDQ
jgi:large subunit ribosomal protein L24